MSALFLFPLVGIIGAVAQLIDGALGMGFGVFSSSLMIAVGLAPAVAVGVVNSAKVFTGLSSGLAHWRFGNVRRDWLLALSISGVLGGALGAYLLTSVPQGSARPWVSLLLLAMGIVIIGRAMRHKAASCEARVWNKKCQVCPQANGWQRLANHAKNNSKAKLSALGFVAAFVSGLSGAYGPIATSGVMVLEKGHPREAVGTVNMAEFFVATTIAITILGRLSFSGFPLGLIAALALGGVLMAPVAAYVCRRVPHRLLAASIGATLILLNIGVVVSL